MPALFKGFLKIKVSKTRTGLTKKEKLERKLSKAILPYLWEKCYSCRRSLDMTENLWCKLNKKFVNKEDTCDKFFGYFKRITIHGSKPHKKGK